MTANADQPGADATSPDEPATVTGPAGPVRSQATSASAVSAPRAAVRWGGIVWGVLLITFAGATLIVISSPIRLAGMTAWIASLTPGAAWALWIALVGLVIVVSSLLGAIGAAQRSRRRRPS